MNNINVIIVAGMIVYYYKPGKRSEDFPGLYSMQFPGFTWLPHGPRLP